MRLTDVTHVICNVDDYHQLFTGDNFCGIFTTQSRDRHTRVLSDHIVGENLLQILKISKKKKNDK